MPFTETVDSVTAHIRYKMLARELKDEIGNRMLDLLAAGAAPDYMALWTAVVLIDPPALVYHTAPRTARDSIMKDGLRSALPSSGTRGVGAVGQPRGVYVGGTPDVQGIWSTESAWDVWEVRSADLPWAHDRLNTGCWMITSDVPVTALCLMEQ